MNKLTKLIILTLIIFILICININSKVLTNMLNASNIIVDYNNILNDKDEYTVSFKYKYEEDLLCSLDDINYIDLKDCTLNLNEGNYTIYMKNDLYKIKKDFSIVRSDEGTYSTSLDNIDEYYLALNGNKTLIYNFDYPDDYNTERTYYIDDDSIISIEDDTIHGLKVGTTNLHVRLNDGNSKTYKITVTNLIQPATYNNDKPYLPCGRYTQEEAALLDKILASRVEEAGIGTRGATLAAARFLTLEFPYMIRYFNENGRLNGHGRPVIDGEGRYYHVGLYLSEDKYKDITKHTATGPKMWGCSIYDQFIAKMNMNGFTCSGFVTWAMLNGGFDVGDVGAGDYKQFDDDLSDMGPHHEITEEYMLNGNYKAGDFIGRNGHAALIIGVDDKNVYTAESLPPKLKAYTYERYHGIVKDDNLTYVIEMSDVYPNGDGFYTDMWE